MTDSVHLEWIETRQKLISWRIDLQTLFEDKVLDEEEVTKELKDALRFATYLNLLLKLHFYPVDMQKAIETANVIASVFEQDGGTFDDIIIANLRVMVMAFEVAFRGDDPDDESDYLVTTMAAPDPAEEDDDYWIVDLMQLNLPSVA